MRIPRIDNHAVQEQIDAATELLAAYEHDLEREAAELQQTKREKVELTALISYAERSEERLAVLRESVAGEDYSLNELSHCGADTLVQYSSFLALVNSHINSCERRVGEINKAIELLRSDVEMLTIISTARFRQVYSYCTFRTPGWSFFRLHNKAPKRQLNIVSLSKFL
ncbi:MULTISPECIES: hypothetical protein [unclassified Pseudomonas]|jgi:chromosome segregation ATPase|uniref:Uncharacterized protein n=1 Tax=Pseudomonas gorinensis TaxID=3240790 RepID=A0ACA7PE01_9PSED|nr:MULTISPECIES: hypothetical protein [unclassified Pseudomonas]AHC38081.1 hypothetical protein U771_28045 [Pseudomonas sp. TKP]PMX14488.1 hypothetical protein C1Y25_14555 [Pseudomonas sp. MPBC4-3]PMX46518.1 hypothetical protein C1Y20_16910 [Pseudomonas sp. FW301-21B01]PMY07373.1 hypothetical protein C1Y18_13195 [Pseudomonas sp. MPR-R5A]PNA68423.1 hypothetical protein C1Y14_14090 [Pseudomonas sp. MPR-R5B]